MPHRKSDNQWRFIIHDHISDSLPIGNDYPVQQQSFTSHKSTPKFDKAVMKLKAANTDSARIANSKVVFIADPTSITEKDAKSNKQELIAIEIDRERIQREQANIITITPAEPSTNILREQSPKEPQPQQKGTPDIDTIVTRSITCS